VAVPELHRVVAHEAVAPQELDALGPGEHAVLGAEDLRQGRFADHVKPMVLLSLNTGLRRGEVFSLRWKDVDFPRRELWVSGEEAKSSNTREIALNDISLELLQAWQAQQPHSRGLVFPSPTTGKRFNNMNKTWRSLMKAAELTSFRWQDMRHDFGTQLAMAGVDLNTIRELLGHSTLDMTLRYSHLAQEHKAQAVAKLNAANVIRLDRAGPD